ncbi:glutamine--fructose-6-phosphate transaminase (isomerizing) [Teredinibacter sp. KSP-S5-2]|uniref:glutamine--fructose-6-phosphate transaminase (isomerizing) n=1 Tax=Teredinibacter sp. KSP-S5-2 TaxID=3034506 RepID=UPI002934962D|nr:glutamine--fructose-6-phosphate transaminase (isomerizing) [Teredinibacter sp. KSP-S5-2]WNO10028.1 glutamine--fructose-6-phosphate transaminase (isomerizing) [Teredinibacter sp. KSP-S5-2]
MCGIVGAVAQRNVVSILLEGLKRLEYRGYDSAGMASIGSDGQLLLNKAAGKVHSLEEQLLEANFRGSIGIAHTRWATHGEPSQKNAHPHKSDLVAVVHNGIIENYESVRSMLEGKGYVFESETDSEVIAHLLNEEYKTARDLILALRQTVVQLRGAYGIAAVCVEEPNTLVAARSGSPLVVGLGIEENFVASDQIALRPVTDRFIYLEEGDLVRLTSNSLAIFDAEGQLVDRKTTRISDTTYDSDKGEYRHYMLKEINEQPVAIKRTLEGRLSDTKVLEEAFGIHSAEIFDRVDAVQIVACGTSYHAGVVAKYIFEEWANIPCYVDIASEFRYRKVITPPNSLFITISQSGETADTLAALRIAKDLGVLATLAICNVANSSIVRESDLTLMTLAGAEIGVASTKAFTTQLAALQILGIVLGRRKGLTPEKEAEWVGALQQLPELCDKVLKLNQEIETISEEFIDKEHALFLGRGIQYPVALEGALKLKEISYIHAEAYPAGELKHGPLALVDNNMPVITVAPNNQLLEKLKANLEEVRARGGKLYVFADETAGFEADENCLVFSLPHVPSILEPIIYTIPLQLLSYHVAVMRGTDVDQPRNLAKSVTVE